AVKKVRCDGVQAGSDPPSCSNCRTYGYECSFIDAPKKRGPPKGYIEALETRLQRMESVLGNLVQSGDLSENTINSNLEWINVNESNFRSSQSFAVKGLSSKKPYDFSISRTLPLSNSKTSANHVKPNKSLRDQDCDTESILSSDDPTCDLVDSLGQLTIDDEGHTRYIGYSSGYFSYIKVFRVTSDAEFLHIPNYNIRFSSVKYATQKAISELPSKELCNQLLDVFWTYVHPNHLFIDKLDFLEKYNNLENNFTTIILLYAMFAIASRTLDIPDVHKDPSDPTTIGREYFDRARELLKNEFDNVSITIIQALLLLAAYHRSAVDSVTWLYSGMAIRTAQEMGLHRNPAKWSFSARQTEIRKRLWWACVLNDIFTSASLGRPLTICEIDCDVDYPTPGIFSEEPRQFVEQLNEGIKIMLILGRVVTHIYSIKSRQNLDDAVLSSLDAELNEWRENLPSNLQYDSAAPYNIIDSKQLLTHVLFYTCQILLHRPYIRGSKSKAISSLTICTMAANNVTHIIHRLMKMGRLKSSWSFLTYPFLTASIMHIINILSDDDRFKEVAKHGIRMTLSCLNHIKPVWLKSEKCVRLIKGLLRAKNINIDGVEDIFDNSRTEGTPSDGQCSRFKDKALTESDKSYTNFSPSQVPSQLEVMPASIQTAMKNQHIVNQPTSTVDGVRNCDNSPLSSLTSYDRISSPESTSNSRFMRLNDFSVNVNNGLFSQNSDSFASDVSPLLFGDNDDSVSENNSFLPFPSTNDLNEWTNWTKYMIRLQTLKTSDNTNNNGIPDILTSSDSNTSTSSARSMFASMTSPPNRTDYNKR
ncbi:5769_t:CDS:2, partial [Racocetra persica]